MRGINMIFIIIVLFFASWAFSQEQGLIAYWSFDEGKGDVAYDYSGNQNDAQIKGAKWVKGISGNALSLDGKNYLICGNGIELCFVFNGDYSLEAWVKHTNKSPQIYIAKWSGSGVQSAFWLGYYENKVQFGDYYEGGHTRIKGPDIADGNWHYVVAIRKGFTLSLYVDSIKVAEGKTIGKIAGDNPAPLLIGSFGFGRALQWAYNGEIDEVRIYSRALSEDEIKKRYQLISSGQKEPTLQPIANDTPLDFYADASTATIYNTEQPINIFLRITSSKPTSTKDFYLLLKKNSGEVVDKIQGTANFQTNVKVYKTTISLPAMKEGSYTLEVGIDGQTKVRKTLNVKDLTAIEQNNIAIKEQRAKTNPFYRGIISAYSGMRYKPDGTPDIETMISLLKDLGVNCYTYLIAYRSLQELPALGDFCQRAMKEGIEVWAYLVPPTEAPKDYPPFGLDYLKWAEAIAKISLEHPNLTLWMIDDFDANLSFFTLAYTQQIYETSKRINPNLLFGVCVYHENLADFIHKGYLAYCDAILWGYQHNSSLYPDCGLFANTLPTEINDYLKTGKIAIPCIYFTPHSSWPLGRPIREYLEEATRIAFEQSGIVWVFTTPSPDSMQYDVVKSFISSHPLPKRNW
ncbi:LamG domain-containing protein [bacterium]|nr:LamG domain-containing protein [bacterium]